MGGRKEIDVNDIFSACSAHERTGFNNYASE